MLVLHFQVHGDYLFKTSDENIMRLGILRADPGASVLVLPSLTNDFKCAPMPAARETLESVHKEPVLKVFLVFQ